MEFTPQVVVYGRIVLYLFTSVVLFLFSVLHQERVRRARGFALAGFFITVAVSLVFRLWSGLLAQTMINDWLTTPALLVYAALLAIDFISLSRNGKR